MAFSTLRESEILIACGWNANLPTGYDYMSHLLTLCNKSYNFSELSFLTNRVSQDIMFSNIPELLSFDLICMPQSTLFLSCLKLVCAFLGWTQFYEEIQELILIEGLSPIQTSSILNENQDTLERHISAICEEFKLFNFSQADRINCSIDISPSSTSDSEDSHGFSMLEAPNDPVLQSAFVSATTTPESSGLKRKCQRKTLILSPKKAIKSKRGRNQLGARKQISKAPIEQKRSPKTMTRK